MAGFELWANEVEAEENKAGIPVSDAKDLKSQPVSKKRSSAVKTTADERELLDTMKQKAAEDFQSEDEPGSEVEKQDEEEEEESSDEGSAELSKRADAEMKAKKSARKETKANTSPPSSQLPSPKSTAHPAPKPVIPKRKATTSSDSDLPASKKSRKYKFADIIENSDDEANYALPVAPAPVSPEQREGWALAEISLVESVEVVQSDNRADVEVEDGIEAVVERGTTIVNEVESPKHAGSDGPRTISFEPAEEAASSSSLSSLFGDKSEGGNIEHVGTQVENEEVDEATLVGLMIEESEASENGEPVSPGLQHEEVDQEDSAAADVGIADSDDSSLSGPPSSDDEVKDDHKPASPISQKEDADTRSTTVTEGNTSDSDEAGLSKPPLSNPESDEEDTLSTPASHKRKGPFDDDDEDENDVNPSKKNKTVRFDEEVYYAFERKRRMSIPYIVEEDEGEDVEDAQNVGSEEVGEVSE